ncbi:MAG: hypothetical protein GF317_04640 [Candidatus Lokiarchaeota archaeon]|nr:hypothetical protein [Candidatus Lokiarchaeota archaeon]
MVGKRINKHNSLVVHLTECGENTIIASARIAKFISNVLGIPLFHRHEDYKSGRIKVKSYDYVFWVCSQSRFSRILKEGNDICLRAKNLISIRNDYHSTVNETTQLVRALILKQYRWLNYMTTIPDLFINSEYDSYVNWNQLTFEKIKFNRKNRTDGLFYYGSYRLGRVDDFKRYFDTDKYNVIVSAPRGNNVSRNFLSINDGIEILPAFKTIKDLTKYKTTLYIEDKKSHDVFCSPANRFYECLSAGVAILFDEKTVPMLKRAGVDVSDFVVTNDNDVADMMKNTEEIAKEQYRRWGKIDYHKKLKEQFMLAIRKIERRKDTKYPLLRGKHNLFLEIDEDVNKKNRDEFLYFVKEREKINNLKSSGKPIPWTNDRVLQNRRISTIRFYDTEVYKYINNNMESFIGGFVDYVIYLYFPCPDYLFNKGGLDLLRSIEGVINNRAYDREIYKEMREYSKDKGWEWMFTKDYNDRNIDNVKMPTKYNNRKINKMKWNLIRLTYMLREGNIENAYKEAVESADSFGVLRKYFSRDFNDDVIYDIYSWLIFTHSVKDGGRCRRHVTAGARLGARLIFPKAQGDDDIYSKIKFSLRSYLEDNYKRYSYCSLQRALRLYAEYYIYSNNIYNTPHRKFMGKQR